MAKKMFNGKARFRIYDFMLKPEKEQIRIRTKVNNGKMRLNEKGEFHPDITIEGTREIAEKLREQGHIVFVMTIA